MNVIIINGPNLNLLSKRDNTIYGKRSFDDFFSDLVSQYKGINLTYFQSNTEGDIINKLQESDSFVDYIVLNAGGYSHTSVSIADCIDAIKVPVIEVHISNIYSREEFRHKSLISQFAFGVIVGFGLDSYKLALENIISA